METYSTGLARVSIAEVIVVYNTPEGVVCESFCPTRLFVQRAVFNNGVGIQLAIIIPRQDTIYFQRMYFFYLSGR